MTMNDIVVIAPDSEDFQNPSQVDSTNCLVCSTMVARTKGNNFRPVMFST